MSTTVGDRLKQLSGMAGATVGAMLLVIGSGATVGAILVNYSGLLTGTVAQHLLVDHFYAVPDTHKYICRVPYQNRSIIMPIDNRLVQTLLENRVFVVPTEPRQKAIDHDLRKVVQAPENRTALVEVL